MAPAVVIRLELEAAPVVYLEMMNDGDEKRLDVWLTEARPEYADLVRKAMELAEETRAS